MNTTIKLLMLSDIFIVTGFGLISPILAIFFKENLIGGTIFTVGLASTIFLIVKSIVQIPFSKYVDRHDHKVRWLIRGTLLISMVPFIYIFSKSIYQIYFAQVLYGIGAAMAYPTWLGLFSTHLDKKHERFEWGLYSTSVGLGAAVTAAVAEYIGFTYTFMLVGLLSLVGCAILFNLERKEDKTNKALSIHYHKRRKLVNHR